jgi:predicted dehydrogenase
MYGVAILGAGNIGGIRATSIQRSTTARVKVVADVDRSRANQLAHSVGAVAKTDWRSALEDPGVDLAVVSTPTKFHAGAVESALRAGKHVLCEKPLARNLAEAETVQEIAARCRLVLKTGYNYRYMAHVRKAHDLIREGAIGAIHFMRARYGHGGRPGYEKHWCTNQDLSGGGVLLEQGIHMLDLMRYLFGEPTSILALAECLFWPFEGTEDNCFILAQCEAGRTAQIHVSWTQWVNLFSVEIFGRDGYLHLTGRDGHYGSQRLIWGKRQSDHSRPLEQEFEFSPPDTSWDLEWKDFVESIGAGREPMSHPADSCRTLQLVEAAYQSSQRREWTDLTPAAIPVRSAR